MPRVGAVTTLLVTDTDKEAEMADRRYDEWQARSSTDPSRGAGRRDYIEGEHEYVRPHIYREQDREPPPGGERRGERGLRQGRGPRAEERGSYGRYIPEEERGGRYGREYPERGFARTGRGYGGGYGDREMGRYTRGPGEEYGEGFWSELTAQRTRGDFNRYGQRDTLHPLPYDTDRYGAGQYGLGARAGDEWSAREDFRRYGWGPGWSQYQGRDRSYGTRGWDEVDVGRLPPEEYALHGRRPPGRGPRSYRRSDERIREDICDRLMQTWMDAEEVNVRVHDGEVTLSGTVKSREEKRAIEDLSEGTLGVREVHNELRVAREQQPQEERRLHS